MHVLVNPLGATWRGVSIGRTTHSPGRPSASGAGWTAERCSRQVDRQPLGPAPPGTGQILQQEYNKPKVFMLPEF